MDDNDLKLKDNPVIADFQDYVQKMKEQRGLNLSDPKLDCMMLAEECGELISAIRKHMKGGSIGSGSPIRGIKPFHRFSYRGYKAGDGRRLYYFAGNGQYARCGFGKSVS